MTPQDKQAFGEAGCDYIASSTPRTGKDFCVIQCITDTVFSTLTNSIGTGDAITGVTIPAGTVLFGKFTAVTRTSGVVCAYNSASRQ